MRLIDADALPIWSYPQVWEEGQGIKKCCDAVENAPTIEAIPVEWINQYIADETNGRKIELQHIRRMLKTWGEEFEDDKCWEDPRLA